VDAKTQAKYEARAKIIKAMAHPTRLFIVDELARSDERCVRELTEMVGVDMSTVSRHLAMLKNAGIVEANSELGATPEIVNQDPYGKGWLAVIDAADWAADRAKLLEPQAYLAVMRSQAEQEAAG